MSITNNASKIINKNIDLNDIYLIDENSYQQKIINNDRVIFQIIDIDSNKILKELVIEKIKYIAIAGSSGGHILPAIKYLNTISKIKNPNQILFITNEVGKEYIKQIENNKINNIAISSKNKTIYILKIFYLLLHC